jgi:hypothetical protein
MGRLVRGKFDFGGATLVVAIIAADGHAYAKQKKKQYSKCTE